MALAGGFKLGDQVLCADGSHGQVVGAPARAACAAISVAVRLADGRTRDERINRIELVVDEEPGDMQEYYDDGPDDGVEHEDFHRLEPPQHEAPAEAPGARMGSRQVLQTPDSRLQTPDLRATMEKQIRAEMESKLREELYDKVKAEREEKKRRHAEEEMRQQEEEQARRIEVARQQAAEATKRMQAEAAKQSRRKAAEVQRATIMEELTQKIRLEEGAMREKVRQDIEQQLRDDDVQPRTQKRAVVKPTAPEPVAAPPTRPQVEAGYDINRISEDRHAAKPLGGEVKAGYGINNRILEDRHAAKPLGGEVKAGYGINNRVVDDRKPVLAAAASTHEASVDVAEDILREKIRRNYRDLRGAFRALDVSNNGFVSKKDFMQALSMFILNGSFSREDMQELVTRFDLDKDGYISFEEFCHCFGDWPSMEPMTPTSQTSSRRLVTDVDMAIQSFRQSVDRRYSSLTTAFRSMDQDRTSAILPAEFSAALRNHGIAVPPDVEEEVRSRFDPTGTGRITYSDFCQVIGNRGQFGKHLSRQTFK